MSRRIATAGVIILITSAGVAFGLMLKNAGVGDAVKALVGDDVSGTQLLLLSWVVAVTVNSLAGLVVCLIFSKLAPLI